MTPEETTQLLSRIEVKSRCTAPRVSQPPSPTNAAMRGAVGLDVDGTRDEAQETSTCVSLGGWGRLVSALCDQRSRRPGKVRSGMQLTIIINP